MGDTGSYTKRLINKYGFTPKKSLGQVFLISDGPILKMVEAIDPREDDFIVEVGPGLGALTRHLAAASDIVAFEIDSRLCDILNAEVKNVTVIHRDFTEIDIGLFIDAYLGATRRRVKICGNLPYNISSKVLIRIATLDIRYSHANFLVQKEVGAKVSCKPGEGDYGRISAMVQTFCNVTRLFDVPAGAFLPMPKVDSTFLRLEHRTDHKIDHQHIGTYSSFVKEAFAQRRKSLFNNLRRGMDLTEDRELEVLDKEILALGGTRNTRPEEMTADQLATLYLRLQATVLPIEDNLP